MAGTGALPPPVCPGVRYIGPGQAGHYQIAYVFTSKNSRL